MSRSQNSQVTSRASMRARLSGGGAPVCTHGVVSHGSVVSFVDTGGLFVVCGKGGGFVCGAGVRGVERAVDLFVARVSCGFSRLFIQLSVVFCDILFLNGWFQFISILLSISRLGNIPMA